MREKGTKNTERQATDSADMHGLICLRQKRVATKGHKEGTKNTERQATDSADKHGLICLRQMGSLRMSTKYSSEGAVDY